MGEKFLVVFGVRRFEVVKEEVVWVFSLVGNFVDGLVIEFEFVFVLDVL